MDYNKYTENELKDMSRTFAAIRAEVEPNTDLFRISYDDEAQIRVEYMNFTVDKYYIISNPRVESGYVYYDTTQKPSNSNNNATTTTIHPSKDNRPLLYLKNWMSLVRNIYNLEQKIHPNSKNINHYQKNIFESFSFLKDENDDEPLKPIKQKELSIFLNLLIENFENDDEIGGEFIEELKSLNKAIPQLTQLQIKYYISHAFAKLMYKGIEALNKITNVGTEVGIGQLFIEGIKSYLN